MTVRLYEEEVQQAALLRCSIGNPWHPTTISPAILAWQGGTVVKMATVIYEERRWEDMPLLGDALEEAGCSDQSVLDHCRGPGPWGTSTAYTATATASGAATALWTGTTGKTLSFTLNCIQDGNVAGVGYLESVQVFHL